MFIRADKGFAMQAGRLIAFLVTLLMLAFASAFPVMALDRDKAISQYVHTAWRTDEGLPQGTVTRIFETSDGYLWIGTQGGLARFDGKRFTVFDHSNTPALKDDLISDLVEDHTGTLWIGTLNGGVTRFRDGVFSHFDAVADRAGNKFAVERDGGLWIGGLGGLTHVRNGKVIGTVGAADGLSADATVRLGLDKDQALWISAAGTLYRLSEGKLHRFAPGIGVPSGSIIGFRLDTDRALLVQTLAGMWRFADGLFERVNYAGTEGMPLQGILRDDDGNLWFGTAGRGLVRISRGKVSRFTAAEGLTSDQINTLYMDRGKNLWVGTSGGGLDRFRDGSFTTFTKAEGLADDAPFAVLEDQGSTWVTGAAGLSQVRGDQVRVFRTGDGLPPETTSLSRDAAGELIIGSTSQGLFRRRGGGFEPAQSERDGLPPFQISGTFVDSSRSLWLLTRGGGVVRRSAGRTRVFNRADGLLDNFLYAIAEGRDGTIWIGSASGLNSLRKDQVGSFGKDSPLTGVFILALLVDEGGTLWIGTLGHGLFRLDGNRLVHYTTHQGLPDDAVNSIVRDRQGSFWIGSNRGIYRVSRADLDNVARGTQTSVTALVFGKADGLKDMEAAAGIQPSASRASDGRLWFATVRGVTVVDPGRIVLNDQPPLARVEQMTADEQSIDLSQPIRLPPGTRRFEVRYTAPSLSAPERTRFRYRLDGFEDKWIAGDIQRVAQFTNVPPGQFRFRVSASSETGRWSERDGGLVVEILPRFYQTTWFRWLGILAICSFAWAAYRLRVNWLHARAAVLEERHRIAGEIHDSLAQGLSGIVFQTEAALISMARAPEKTAGHLESARDLAKTSLDEARYSVWNITPPDSAEKNLFDSLLTMARQLGTGRVDDLDVHTSGESWRLSPAAEHHVVLIAQEALSNAIQHGRARAIEISLLYSVNELTLRISDNGVGLGPPSQQQAAQRGFGMQNMLRRSRILGAHLDVTSDGEDGTLILLRVPRPTTLARLWQWLRGFVYAGGEH